jgi:hypothetical protein
MQLAEMLRRTRVYRLGSHDRVDGQAADACHTMSALQVTHS